MSDVADKLTDKQRVFVERYLTHWNGTRAAVEAGYSERTAAVIASENLTKPNIQAAVQARLAELKITSDEVLTRLTAHARGDMGDFLRVDEEDITLTWSVMRAPATDNGDPDMAGVVAALAMRQNVTPTDIVLQTATVKRAVARLDLLAAGQQGHLRLVKKYTLDKDGRTSIELYDAQAALIKLGEHFKLWTQRTELTGADGGPITSKTYVVTQDFNPDDA